ncbi:MAG: hypothetical protein GX329_04290 [Tissierellia bacterium]|nr:hypothetical protein [Tissierellia bacterium]
MKVNDLVVLNQLNMDVNYGLLKEGDTLEGIIIKAIDDIAFIEIEDLGVFRAHMGEPIDLHEGVAAKFLIKKLLPNRIELKPISFDMGHDRNMESISIIADSFMELLTEFGIEYDSTSIDILEMLIKYNVKLDKDNITKGLKIFNKLKELLDMGSDDTVRLLDSNKKSTDMGKVDITNLIIEKNIGMEEGDSANPMVGRYLSRMNILGDKLEPRLIQIVGFLIKSDMEPHLHNIKYLLELAEEPLLFSEDFKTLEKIFGKKFTNLFKKGNINSGSYDLISERDNNGLKQILSDIKKIARQNNLLNDRDISRGIEELSNRMEFMDEIDSRFSLIHIPLGMDNKDPRGILTLFKEKKNRYGVGDRFNIFINLRTLRLGDIKIFCQLMDLSIDIRFSNVHESDHHLFKSKEGWLRSILQSLGYHVGKIEYISADDYSVLDALIVNERPTYSLDIKV